MRNSILAALPALDQALFLDLAQRAGMSGIQEWLSFYFKSPMASPELHPERDIFIQLRYLKNRLRWMAGEQMITHLALEYYGWGPQGLPIPAEGGSSVSCHQRLPQEPWLRPSTCLNDLKDSVVAAREF